MRAVHHLALGYWHAAGLEQALGEVFVAGDALGDGAGEFGLGRPDAALRCAIAQLHQVAVVQADVRNAAVGRCSDNAGRAGAKIAVVHHRAYARHCGAHVKRQVVDGRHEERVAFCQRAARHLLFTGPKHHAVDAVLAGRARLSEACGHAGQVEQFDDDMLQHVAAPGALLQALQETAALADAAVVLNERRQPGGETIIEARKLVRGVAFKSPQVQPDLQRGAVGPDIGATQIVDAQKFDVFEGCHGALQGGGE